jgi:hypothetical protein
MVISEPEMDPEQVLIVNVTTWRRDKDQSCLIGPEHYELITHNSCVQYPMSRVYPDGHLNSLLADGKIILHSPLSPEVLRMVREGAAASNRMKLAHGQIILDQGLVVHREFLCAFS